MRTVTATMSDVFEARGETFGLETDSPWAMPALRILFSAPRAYGPLVDAWDVVHPGTRKALERLVELRLVDYQPGLIVDTRTGESAAKASRRVPRYRTTSRGKRLIAAVREDSRVLDDLFPRTDSENRDGVWALLEGFNLQDSHAKYGLSTAHATSISGLPVSNVKWWIRMLRQKGYLRELPVKYADVREVIPEHWRPTRALSRQLLVVLDAFPQAPQEIRAEFRLNRSRYLADIDPARVGISGATDFDHDVECQRVLAHLLRSPASVPEGVFAVEPKFPIPTDTGVKPWHFTKGGDELVFYQPDAQIRERFSGKVARSVIEYERFQTRRDGWNHIERFLGFLATSVVPFEPAILRFVVDSQARERGYVELIEAFADYILDNPHRAPANSVTLAVSNVERLEQATDPLSAEAWFLIPLPQGEGNVERAPVLHPADNSPFDEYFSRG